MDFIGDEDNVMIDIETFDVRPTAVIRSIGACKFNKNGILCEFYVNVDEASCVELGLTKSNETVAWWNGQPSSAKEILEVDKKPLIEALRLFNEWYGEIPLNTWGNGAAFDNVILEHAFSVAGIACPWKFWNNRCFRTVKSSQFDKTPIFKGIMHYALDDAVNEARWLVKINENIPTEKKSSGLPVVIYIILLVLLFMNISERYCRIH